MRLFVALDLSNEAAEYLAKVQASLTIGAKLSLASGYHVTLFFLGEVLEEKVESIKQMLSTVDFQGFTITVKGIGFFRRGAGISVIWAAVDPHKPIIELQKKIATNLGEIGFKGDDRFHPHVTLARVKYIADAGSYVDYIKGMEKKELSSRIDSFVLYKSTLTSQGPIYSVVGRYKLKGHGL